MNQDDLSLAALTCLVDVAAEGSFAAVARKRQVDPSIISRTIAGLERALGFRLFDRTTRRLHMTEAGAIYLQRAGALVAEFDDARSAARDALSEPSGVVRITASTAFGVYWLTPRLAGFMERFPEITLEAVLTDAVVDIAAERIDLALRLAVRPSGDLVSTRLMATRYRVVANSAHVAAAGGCAAPEDLARRDCLLLTLPGYRSLWSFRHESQSPRQVTVHGRLAISSPAAVHRAALDGLGPALLPEWMIAEDLARGSLVDLLPGWEASAADFDTAAWILYPSRAYVPRKVRVLVDYLKSVV
jgi:DNA-binding transcriptional LysR family regulator